MAAVNPNPAAPASGPLVSRAWLGTCLVLMGLHLISRLTNSAADPDLWGYLAFGRQLWQTGVFPYHDPFSYLPTKPLWVYHEWLTGALLHPLFRLGGGEALQALKLALGLGAAGLVLAIARCRGADWPGALGGLFLISGVFALGYSPVRAQAFTILFWVLTLYLLESHRLGAGPGRLWLLAPLMALWANLHGGFVAGLGLMGLYALGALLEKKRPILLLALLAACVLATLLNPYGLDYWRYLVPALTMPRPHIVEWHSLPQALAQGEYLANHLYFLLLVLVAGLFIFSRGWRQPTPLLVLAVTVALGFSSLRHQVFFPLALAAYLHQLPSELADRARRSSLAARLTGWPAAGLVALLGLVLLLRLAFNSPLALTLPADPSHPKYYPVGAIQFIEQHNLRGKLLARFEWGELLIWRLHPACSIGLDGRYETVFPHPVIQDYWRFMLGQKHWPKLIQDFPPDLILLRKNSAINQLMQNHPDWQSLYTDAGCQLWKRR